MSCHKAENDNYQMNQFALQKPSLLASHWSYILPQESRMSQMFNNKNKKSVLLSSPCQGWREKVRILRSRATGLEQMLEGIRSRQDRIMIYSFFLNLEFESQVYYFTHFEGLGQFLNLIFPINKMGITIEFIESL